MDGVQDVQGSYHSPSCISKVKFWMLIPLISNHLNVLVHQLLIINIIQVQVCSVFFPYDFIQVRLVERAGAGGGGGASCSG